MKETTGQIINWDETSGQGTIQGDDGKNYSFTKKEWTEDKQPEIHGGVLIICQNGRDASKVEYLPIEHIPKMKIDINSPDGELLSTEQRRFIGGPWRIRSDALAWMMTARGIHSQLSQLQIKDISILLLREHPLISLRGSVIKYCYGLSIELYLKWILIEAKKTYKQDHRLKSLINKLPEPVLDNLRNRYSEFRIKNQTEFRMMTADVQGKKELKLDWSTFDKFIENIDKLKFIIGRYATPESYSIIPSSSEKLSKEMNSYMDSNDFFDLADKILSYEPDLKDYE